MPHRLVPVLSSLLLALYFACAPARAFYPLPPDLDGSMMPIDFTSCSAGKWLPDSLKPVFASYVSRHGARYLSGPAKTDLLEKSLQAAVNTGTLSETGEHFLALLRQIILTNRDHWGDLSPLGIEEQKVMGSRVFGLFPPLHRPHTRVSAIASYVPRCVMTMYEFSGQLLRLNDSISVATDEGLKYNPLLCCFIADKEYARYRKEGDWKPVYDDFVRRNVSPEPARRLLDSSSLSDDKLRKLTMAMYEILKANRASGLPAPSTQWMTEKEYRQCWRADNLSHYLRNTITPLSSLAGRATTPLALRIIEDIDNATGQLRPNPTLAGYFGHAETLMPLLSLLRIPGCFALPLDYDNLDKYWKVQDVTPLGANLLVMLSIGPSGTPYIAIQLNGRTVKPMKGHPDLIPWPTLRLYWLDLINTYR